MPACDIRAANDVHFLIFVGDFSVGILPALDSGDGTCLRKLHIFLIMDIGIAFYIFTLCNVQTFLHTCALYLVATLLLFTLIIIVFGKG